MITKEIYQIGGSGFTAPEDAAVYLIHMGGRAAIVDAGCGNATGRLLENIRRCNVPDAVIHMPGHSPGSLVYQVVSEGQKVLFAQDVHGPVHPDLLSDQEAYQGSLKKMLELNADILCEGHYGIFNGKTAVREFISSFMV